MSSPKRKLVSNEASGSLKRRKTSRQSDYHSSSESDAVSQSENTTSESESLENISEPEDYGYESDVRSDSIATPLHEAKDKTIRKRNDPSAFSASISKILHTKLTSTKRSDPVLSRSRTALDATKELSEGRLEVKAKHKLREDKKAKLDNGRIRDVLGLEDSNVSTQVLLDREKFHKKTAQRGVVRMFNAIRAAQVMGEKTAEEIQLAGVVGIDKRKQKVNEMSKKSFLELIAGGGKK